MIIVLKLLSRDVKISITKILVFWILSGKVFTLLSAHDNFNKISRLVRLNKYVNILFLMSEFMFNFYNIPCGLLNQKHVS
jgi:hypothetical protein